MALKKRIEDFNSFKFFGRNFMEVMHFIEKVEGFPELRVLEIEKTIEEIADCNQRRKEKLCSQIPTLNKEECLELKRLVEGEQFLGILKKCFQSIREIEQGPHLLDNRSLYFKYLQDFILASTATINKNEKYKEEIQRYFFQLAHDMREIKKVYVEKIKTVKEWEEWKGHIPVGSPIMVYSNDKRFQLLRNIDVLEKMEECFEENAISKSYLSQSLGKGVFKIDRNIEYFTFKGDIEI